MSLHSTLEVFANLEVSMTLQKQLRSYFKAGFPNGLIALYQQVLEENRRLHVHLELSKISEGQCAAASKLKVHKAMS